MTAEFNPEIGSVMDRMLLDQPGVTAGRMFGYPAYYVGRRLFACVYGDGVGVKLPVETAEELAGSHGVSYFQPLGRARMRSWVFLERRRPGDYCDDRDIFLASIEYVSSMPERRSARSTKGAGDLSR